MGGAEIAPSTRNARTTMLEKPIKDWSEEQVQAWITLIGLPEEHVPTVQQALSDDATDGEDLDVMTEDYRTSGRVKVLQKVLRRAGIEDAAKIAELTMQLHDAALGDAPSEDKRIAAEQALTAARR